MFTVEWNDQEGNQRQRDFDTLEDAQQEAAALEEKFDYVAVIAESEGGTDKDDRHRWSGEEDLFVVQCLRCGMTVDTREEKPPKHGCPGALFHFLEGRFVDGGKEPEE